MINSFRESLVNIHGVISGSNVSSPSSQSGEEIAEKSQAIPNSLIKEQWQLILGQDASISDLEAAIERCKELVLTTDECSEERKWLVRHLVELRFHLKELQEAIEDSHTEIPNSKVILGHHFTIRNSSVITRSLPTVVREYCDHCTGIIWNVVQTSYTCSDCGFLVHYKCLFSVIRICAHIIASERKYPILEICPEIGLAAQSYKCGEQQCHTPLHFKGSSWNEPRLCDYCGLFYCSTCHWNDKSIIPARVVHNWDFSPRKVCRASLQEINLQLEKPVINLEEINPKLFIFLQKLSTIKKQRENLSYMRKYLSECRKGNEEKLLEHNIGNRRYLIQSADMYSISDLIQAEAGTLEEFLNKIFDNFDKHIRNCDICSGKGYICEICGNNEIIYPFDDCSISCDKCSTIYHRVCWTKRNMICPKCTRLEERKTQKQEQNVDGNENTKDYGV